MSLVNKGHQKMFWVSLVVRWAPDVRNSGSVDPVEDMDLQAGGDAVHWQWAFWGCGFCGHNFSIWWGNEDGQWVAWACYCEMKSSEEGPAWWSSRLLQAVLELWVPEARGKGRGIEPPVINVCPTIPFLHEEEPHCNWWCVWEDKACR